MQCWCESHAARLVRRSATAALLSASLSTSSGTTALKAEDKCDRTSAGHSPVVQVGAVLVVGRPISTSALDAMQAEAVRIWGRYAIGIDWHKPGPAVDSSVNVVVLVSAETGRCVPWRANREDTLGCFPHDAEGSALPVIRLFPDSVRSLVDRRVAQICNPCQDRWLERLTATLLGRTLAHEIGHYLLGSEHSATGLMRARFEPAELFTDEEEALSLSDAQIASLNKVPCEGR
jgi:hypothetical protein